MTKCKLLIIIFQNNLTFCNTKLKTHNSYNLFNIMIYLHKMTYFHKYHFVRFGAGRFWSCQLFQECQLIQGVSTESGWLSTIPERLSTIPVRYQAYFYESSNLSPRSFSCVSYENQALWTRAEISALVLFPTHLSFQSFQLFQFQMQGVFPTKTAWIEFTIYIIIYIYILLYI